MAVSPIPPDYPRLSPYLVVDGAAQAIAFYRDVLGAELRMQMPGPGGRIGHAELSFGDDSLLMLADEHPEMGILGPKKVGGTAVTISLYVDDVDATFASALAAGAVEERPVATQFYGDRLGQFLDPWGHRWSVATHVEDVSPEEMQRRAEAERPGGG